MKDEKKNNLEVIRSSQRDPALTQFLGHVKWGYAILFSSAAICNNYFNNIRNVP